MHWIGRMRVQGLGRLVTTAMAACVVNAALSSVGDATELAVPSADGAQLPNWATDAEGTPWLSWVAPRGAAWVLLGAPLGTTGFGAAREFAAGTDWFVNWADTPGLVLIRGELEPYGLAYTHGGRGYALWVGDPDTMLHADRSAVEHGFFSSAAGLGFWLDGRQYAEQPVTEAQTELRARPLAGGDEVLIDARVCDCCGTAAVALADGGLLVYRDRSAGDVRDIAIVRIRDGGFEPPRIVHADDWVIRGCPVNGPALAMRDDRVAVLWFTAAGDEPRVKLATASARDLAFSAPVVVDSQAALGRVDLAAWSGGFVATWLRSDAEADAAQLRYAVMDETGVPLAAGVAATTSAARASGFPRVVVLNDRAFVAHTDVAAGRIRVHEIPMPVARTQG